MKDGFANFERRAERERLLGEAFQPVGEFQMWIRPPNPTTRVAIPEALLDQFVTWFQGSDPGGPLIEVIIKGSGGSESIAEFQTAAYAALKAAEKFPLQDPEKVPDPQSFTSMHDNRAMTFDLYQGTGKRQTQGAAAPVDYQWLIYFGEEQTQKIMVCFVIPDSKYSDFQKALTTCMESLALAGKVALALQGGGGAPAGG